MCGYFETLNENIEGLSWICELNYHRRTLRKKTVDRYVAKSGKRLVEKRKTQSKFTGGKLTFRNYMAP